MAANASDFNSDREIVDIVFVQTFVLNKTNLKFESIYFNVKLQLWYIYSYLCFIQPHDKCMMIWNIQK